VTPVPGVPAGAIEGFVPKAIAFADADHGWVAGSTGAGALVLETADGGRTWSPHQVGPWAATAIAAAPGGPWVSRPCPEDEPDCTPALIHPDAAGVWQPTAAVAPMSIAFAGDTGVLALVLPGGPRQGSGIPIPAVRVTNDGGATWNPALNPCGNLDLEDLAAASPTELLVLCGGQGAGGGQQKALFASADLGASWEARASTDDGLPLPGTKIRIDIASDGTGLWWGAGTPVMATSDSGRTWRALDIADGEARIAGAGAALGGGSGYLLVGDGSRNASVLLWTADGAIWDERAVWLQPPCCGG
jgi:photosystem II stability/assembly factor-like uncharacterized protein